MKIKKPSLLIFICFVSTASCSPPPEQPELRTYGNIFPLCLIICEVHTVTNDADPGATVTANTSDTSTGGSKSGGATINNPSGGEY